MTIRLEIIEKGEALYGTEEQSAMEETEEFGMDEKRNELLRSILSDESDGRVEVTDSGDDGDAVNGNDDGNDISGNRSGGKEANSHDKEEEEGTQ